MSIKTSRNKSVKLIDRILPEFKTLGTEGAKPYINDFCCLLKKAGVDMFEVDAGSSEDVFLLQPEMEFIYRIKTEHDMEKLYSYGFRHCIIDSELIFNREMMCMLKTKGIDITVELLIDEASDMLKLINPTKLEGIDCIRFIGMNRITDSGWTYYLKKIKEFINIKVDICPQNRFYSANALAMEALVDDADMLTTSFLGFGEVYGYAATEGVLAAANCIYHNQDGTNLKDLMRIGQLFEHITGYRVPNMTPVIGKDIFKYESGIHADGIGKNPITYEPYDPTLVGQERKLVIGKHSGKKAIRNKLREWKVDWETIDLDFLLEAIREKSIELRRSLLDEEVIDLIKFDFVSGF